MSVYPRVRTYVPTFLRGMMDRFRFPGTLRTRLTAAFSALALVAAVLVTVALANHAASVELDAQRRVGESLLRVVGTALQLTPRQSYAPGLDDVVSKAVEDSALAGIRISDADNKLYEYLR